MQRSKLFLSLTTGILAIVAFAASKKYNTSTVCYTTGGAAHTKVFVQKACCWPKIGNALTCRVNGHIAFTSVNCGVKLYTCL
jgi:hypothetical protein